MGLAAKQTQNIGGAPVTRALTPYQNIANVNVGSKWGDVAQNLGKGLGEVATTMMRIDEAEQKAKFAEMQGQYYAYENDAYQRYHEATSPQDKMVIADELANITEFMPEGDYDEQALTIFGAWKERVAGTTIRAGTTRKEAAVGEYQANQTELLTQEMVKAAQANPAGVYKNLKVLKANLLSVHESNPDAGIIAFNKAAAEIYDAAFWAARSVGQYDTMEALIEEGKEFMDSKEVYAYNEAIKDTEIDVRMGEYVRDMVEGVTDYNEAYGKMQDFITDNPDLNGKELSRALRLFGDATQPLRTKEAKARNEFLYSYELDGLEGRPMRPTSDPQAQVRYYAGEARRLSGEDRAASAARQSARDEAMKSKEAQDALYDNGMNFHATEGRWKENPYLEGMTPETLQKFNANKKYNGDPAMVSALASHSPRHLAEIPLHEWNSSVRQGLNNEQWTRFNIARQRGIDDIDKTTYATENAAAAAIQTHIPSLYPGDKGDTFLRDAVSHANFQLMVQEAMLKEFQANNRQPLNDAQQRAIVARITAPTDRGILSRQRPYYDDPNAPVDIDGRENLHLYAQSYRTHTGRIENAVKTLTDTLGERPTNAELEAYLNGAGRVAATLDDIPVGALNDMRNAYIRDYGESPNDDYLLKWWNATSQDIKDNY